MMDNRQPFVAMVKESANMEQILLELKKHDAHITEVHYMLNGILGDLPSNVDLQILAAKIDGIEQITPGDTSGEKDTRWEDCARAFAKTLSVVLEVGCGVCVHMPNSQLDTTSGRVIVHNDGENIHIIDCPEDFPDGTFMTMGEDGYGYFKS